MSQSPPPQLARLAETIARQTPGVADLFRPGTLLGNAATAIAEAATGAVSPALVDLSLRDRRLHLTMAIGVTAAAAETTRVLRDALAAALSEAGYPDAVIHLTIAQIAV